MNITCQNLYHMPHQPSTYITPRARKATCWSVTVYIYNNTLSNAVWLLKYINNIFLHIDFWQIESLYSIFYSFICRRNAREDKVIWWQLTIQQKIIGSDPKSWLQVNCSFSTRLFDWLFGWLTSSEPFECISSSVRSSPQD